MKRILHLISSPRGDESFSIKLANAIIGKLRDQYPGRKIPSGNLPVWLTHVLGWFDKSMQPVLLDLGKERKADSSKARNVLGWQPISNTQAVLSCAESLISLGLIK